jgi:chaperonin GroEL
VGKVIVTGDEARHKLLAGVNLIADAVKRTLGPSGQNCVYARTGTRQPFSSRDGVTVAREIEASDPHEQMGVALIQGVANEAVDASGDGTTTATLLAQAIFAEGVKAITVGSNAVVLKRGIEKATAAVVEALRGMSRPVEKEMIKQVATISANNDEFLGNLIATAIEKSGSDGVVTVEVSRSPETSLVIVDGMQIATGYISSDFVTNRERNECVLEDVAILLYEGKLATLKPLAPVLEELRSQNKSILIVAEDVVDEALAILAYNTQKGLLKSCAARVPGGLEHLYDIAALTRARVATETMSVKLKDIDVTYFGHAKRVILKTHNSTIIASDGENPRLNERLQELRTQVTDATDERDRVRLQSRLARLAGGVAIIRLGAATELEMVTRKEAVEDAMHATRGAIAEGVVIGGGMALLRSVAWIDDEAGTLKTLRKEYGEGVEIVLKACRAPLKTLAENYGKSPEYVMERVMSPIENWRTYGWNALTDKYGDMFEMGIIDPLRVVRIALESAASVAGLMLITHTLCADEPTK